MSKRDRSEFSLEGRFLGFSPQGTTDNKYIDLLTAQGGHRIRLRKSLRPILADYLLPGDLIRVLGEQKADDSGQSSRMKALKIVRLAPDRLQNQPVEVDREESFSQTAPPQETPKHAKTSDQKSGKILVCEKSSCRKRGSAKVCQQLTDSLEQAGLSDRVTLKKTGCMGHCKSGPHLVFMPDKKRYSGVEPKAAAALIDQHFGNSEGDRQS